jgi:hypothetical protein
LATASCRQLTTNGSLPLLTSAEQVRNLAPEEAERGYPVRIRGIQTYSDVDSKMLIVQDRTTGVVVYKRPSPNQPRQGRVVEVEGFTGRGESSTVIISSNLTSLETIEMPPAQPVSLGDLASIRHAYQWVEIEGIVRSVTTASVGDLVLDLATPEGQFQAFIVRRGTLIHTRTRSSTSGARPFACKCWFRRSNV